MICFEVHDGLNRLEQHDVAAVGTSTPVVSICDVVRITRHIFLAVLEIIHSNRGQSCLRRRQRAPVMRDGWLRQVFVGVWERERRMSSAWFLDQRENDGFRMSGSVS